MSITYSNSLFSVEIDGVKLQCSKIRNLAFSIEFSTARVGDDRSHTVENTLGNKIYEPVILERPLQDKDETFFKLWKNGTLKIENGERRIDPMIIQLLDNTANAIATWSLANAQIVRLSYSNFDAQGNAVLTEVLEVLYEGIGFEMH